MPEANEAKSPVMSMDFKVELAHYLQAAAAIPEAEITTCRANTDLTASNIRIGVSSISEPGIIDRIRRELPTVEIEPLQDLRRLGETVAHAARQVTGPAKSLDKATALKQAIKVRRSLFKQIEVLVDAGILTAGDCGKMRKGRGSIDMANDLIDAAALLTRRASELENKLAIKPELIPQAQALGTYLRQTVTPNASVRRPQPDSRSEAAETRDRLWTLLLRRHKELRRVARWLWPDDADQRVPALLARQHKRKGEEAAEGVRTPG